MSNVLRMVAGWSDAPAGGWNSGSRVVSDVNRVPLQGLTLINQDPALDPATKESAAGRAILCVPSALDVSKPVDVLLHLHGQNIGYRQRIVSGLPDAASVRDVLVDQIEDQLAHLARSMVALLPQGTVTPSFGMSGASGFDCNTFLDEALTAATAAGVWTSEPSVSRVILSAHGAGGRTIGGLVGQPGQPRVPHKIAALAFFGAINDQVDLKNITGYLIGKLNYDLLNIQNLDPNTSDQLTYLRSSMRFRGFYNPSDTIYADNYLTLRQSIIAWFAQNADAIGGDASDTYKALASNYEIVATTNNTANDNMVGSGNLLNALNELG